MTRGEATSSNLDSMHYDCPSHLIDIRYHEQLELQDKQRTIFKGTAPLKDTKMQAMMGSLERFHLYQKTGKAHL